MAAPPPDPHGGPGSEDRGRARDRGRRGAVGWRRLSDRAWQWLRTLPGWVQLLLWLTVWPAVAALFVARSPRLGPLAAPVTVATLLVTGPLWWSMMTGAGAHPASSAAEAAQRWAAPPTGGLGTVTFAENRLPADLAEFDPDTLDIEVVECVQTRSASTVRDGTIRQPRIVVRVTNHGPERAVALQGAVLLEGYGWNEGWKPTAAAELELGHGHSAEVTLLTDYRHQSSYSPDGLHACRLIDLQILAPQVWPEHPARQVLPLHVQTVAGSERDFDPQRDLLRPDTR